MLQSRRVFCPPKASGSVAYPVGQKTRMDSGPRWRGFRCPCPKGWNTAWQSSRSLSAYIILYNASKAHPVTVVFSIKCCLLASCDCRCWRTASPFVLESVPKQLATGAVQAKWETCRYLGTLPVLHDLLIRVQTGKEPGASSVQVLWEREIHWNLYKQNYPFDKWKSDAALIFLAEETSYWFPASNRSALLCSSTTSQLTNSESRRVIGSVDVGVTSGTR